MKGLHDLLDSPLRIQSTVQIDADYWPFCRPCWILTLSLVIMRSVCRRHARLSGYLFWPHILDRIYWQVRNTPIYTKRLPLLTRQYEHHKSDLEYFKKLLRLDRGVIVQNGRATVKLTGFGTNWLTSKALTMTMILFQRFPGLVLRLLVGTPYEIDHYYGMYVGTMTHSC